MNAEEARAKLEEYRASINTRREKLARHVSHREEPLPQDFADQAVELENDETMVALEDELYEQLKAVDDALARIEEGTYGVCVECGEPIALERLDALPAAPMCIDCASVMER